MKKKLTALIMTAVMTMSFVSAHADNADQIQGIDMSALIGAPLQPAYPHEYWNWQEYLNSLLNSQNNNNISHVTYRFPNGGVVEVPVLKGIPVDEPVLEVVPETTTKYHIEGQPNPAGRSEGMLDFLEMMNSTIKQSSQNRLGVSDNNTLTQLEAMTTLWEIYALNIMNGSDDGNLMLDKEVTKAEFVKMVVTALGEEPFKPLPNAHWAQGYIKTGIYDGWLTGDIADFDYDNHLTYIEAETMLGKILGYGDGVDSVDLSEGTGYEHDNEIITRYEAAVMLHNALNTPICADGQIMDGKGNDYCTLLTEAHSIYTACGYIESVDDLEDNYRYVRFTVQKSNNLNGAYIDKSDESTYISIDTLLDDTQAEHYEGKYVQVLLKNRDDEFYSILSVRNLEI